MSKWSRHLRQRRRQHGIRLDHWTITVDLRSGRVRSTADSMARYTIARQQLQQYNDSQIE